MDEKKNKETPFRDYSSCNESLKNVIENKNNINIMKNETITRKILHI